MSDHSKWSLLRGLGYFFGNHDAADEFARLRVECADLRERLLRERRIRPLPDDADKLELTPSEPTDDYQSWEEKRKAEIIESQALDAVKGPVVLEQFEYYAEVDPELYNPVLLKADQIKRDIAAGTYREPQER